MNKYGQVAVRAAKYVEKGEDPDIAWERASCEIFSPGSSSQKKGCPKNAFLGLYGGTGKNAEYAKIAMKYLQTNNYERITPNELWTIVMAGDDKIHNQQMHVVLSLYEEGLI